MPGSVGTISGRVVAIEPYCVGFVRVLGNYSEDFSEFILACNVVDVDTVAHGVRTIGLPGHNLPAIATRSGRAGGRMSQDCYEKENEDQKQNNYRYHDYSFSSFIFIHSSLHIEKSVRSYKKILTQTGGEKQRNKLRKKTT